MSSFLILARDTQQDEKVKKLHDNLNASLRYASSAQGIEPPPTAISDIPHAERNTILNILTAAGIIPKGQVIELGGILLHTRTSPAPPPDSKHTLLSLPPEIRNQIYRAVLIEPHSIAVREGVRPPEEPALLATCRHIRNEALGIFWKENNFEILVCDFAASFYIKWCGVSKKTSDSRYNSTHTFTLSGDIDWWYLKNWLRAFFEGECHCFDAENANKDMAAAAYLFDVVAEMRDHCSWNQVDAVLVKTLPLLKKQSDAWSLTLNLYSLC
ncbi:hypothetical protein LTR36_005161 [Oleoguttula mirabilis]|uniref:Uncharacterized protein n=1 Tax=Oleoguttula mirabilis TaxID=1507867 RepID=A0AAV9JW89_9PEZI|nr:hypothetical protein LTR36_005161 [Oleoguttula mirabilis]